MTTSIRLTAFLAALVAVPALASAGPGERGTCKRDPARFAAKLAKYDANGDGSLDRVERRQARQERRAKMLERFDADGDGQLGAAEKTTMRRERVAARIAKLDGDGDGAISRSEAATTCSRLERRFARLDSDGSGTLTAAELEAARDGRFRKGKRRGRHHRGGGEAR